MQTNDDTRGPLTTRCHHPRPGTPIAECYDQFVAPGEDQLAQSGLDLAGLQAGDRFLDVAAGPGGLSCPQLAVAPRSWPRTGPRR